MSTSRMKVSVAAIVVSLLLSLENVVGDDLEFGADVVSCTFL
jgi:hypothetical protein